MKSPANPRHRALGSARRLLLAGLLVIATGAKALDCASYHLGDVVGEEIVTPVAMAVADPAATAALKASEAAKTPAVFRINAAITNCLASQFHVAFEAARASFANSLQDAFHATVLDHAAITSPDFSYLVTAYNFDHPALPIPNYLAMDWAYGRDGSMEEAKWIKEICAFMQYPIRPDELPDGFDLGDNVQLVPVSQWDESLTAGEVSARGRMVAQLSILPLSRAQMALRREFTGADEQLLARALAAWVQPNCLLDQNLTREIRERSVQRLVVADYYAAGQVVAPKGAVVDRKILAALSQMMQKSTDTSAAPASEWREADIPVSGDPLALFDQAINADSGPPLPEVRPYLLTDDLQSNLGLLGAAAGLAATAVFLIYRINRRQKPGNGLARLPKELESQNAPDLQSDLGPQLLKVVRQAFIQELSSQRRDLLMVQHTAATEVVQLVQRMDSLQIALQDRLRTYETRIKQLESELTARKEENRQLIRLKIQMFRHQVNLETSLQRIELN